MIMLNQILSEAKKLLDEKKYYLARKIILSNIPHYSYEVKLWDYLAESFFKQHYYREAYEIYYCIYLIQPFNKVNANALKDCGEKLEHVMGIKGKEVNFEGIFNFDEVSVTACLIFKNNIDTIENWYLSLKNKVDQIIVVDTGSNDGTSEYFFSKKDVTVINYPWDDNFSNARNAVIPFITSDWVIWSDSDEYYAESIVGFNSIKFVASYYNSLNLCPVLSVKLTNLLDNEHQVSYEQLRMYPTKKRFKYTSRIHEQIIEDGKSIYDVKHIEYTGIPFIHTGYTSKVICENKKMQRNIRLLNLQIKEDPNNPCWWMFIGREYFNLKEFEKAIEYLKFAKNNLVHEPKFNRELDIYNYLAMAYFELQQFNEAKSECKKALSIDRNFPNALYYLNLIEVKEAMDKLEKALSQTREIKESFVNYSGPIVADESILSWRADLLAADILRYSGFLAESLKIINILSNLNPKLNLDSQKEFIRAQNESLKELL